jgi:hypothetical protein
VFWVAPTPKVMTLSPPETCIETALQAAAAAFLINHLQALSGAGAIMGLRAALMFTHRVTVTVEFLS